ncbi:MAG: DUF4920 domain-containing protein [Chitinophagales bacterium]|nr:DUF4920 domain-containing protein [Chitinophagales bacterium]
MKNLLYLSIIFSSLLFACKQQNKEANSATEDLEYFGKPITLDGAIASNAFFDNFTDGDSVEMKLTGQINKVCKKKGCWMTINLPENQELLVQFKDYGFFVPLNADGRTATIEGWAFKEVRPVEELKHYAFDEGKTQEEIDAITEPEVSYSFIADGVILE